MFSRFGVSKVYHISTFLYKEHCILNKTGFLWKAKGKKSEGHVISHILHILGALCSKQGGYGGCFSVWLAWYTSPSSGS